MRALRCIIIIVITITMDIGAMETIITEIIAGGPTTDIIITTTMVDRRTAGCHLKPKA
jgi:hypothetical protein